MRRSSPSRSGPRRCSPAACWQRSTTGRSSLAKHRYPRRSSWASRPGCRCAETLRCRRITLRWATPSPSSILSRPSPKSRSDRGPFPSGIRAFSSAHPSWPMQHSALLYPLHLVYLVLPVHLAWSAMIFLRTLLAVFLAALLAREIGASRAGAIASGLIFAHCGFMVGWQVWPHADSALWLPLTFYAVLRLRRRPTGAAVALTGCAFALPVLAGHPEIAVYTVLAGIAFWLFCLLPARNPATPPAPGMSSSSRPAACLRSGSPPRRCSPPSNGSASSRAPLTSPGLDTNRFRRCSLSSHAMLARRPTRWEFRSPKARVTPACSPSCWRPWPSPPGARPRRSSFSSFSPEPHRSPTASARSTGFLW